MLVIIFNTLCTLIGLMISNKVDIHIRPIQIHGHCVLDITVGDKTVNTLIKENVTYSFDYPKHERLLISMVKTGKDINLVKAKKEQSLQVSVELNGFKCHAELFGQFFTKNNPYVNDQTLQTNILSLNGTWVLNVPIWYLDGKSAFEIKSKMRDLRQDSSIATFGCSFTYGWCTDNMHTWPSQLKNLTGRKVCNYGVGGSNNTEIINTALDYTTNYNTHDVVILLCHFCRLQLTDNVETISTHPQLPMPKKKHFKEEIKKLIMFGETELIFAGQSLSLLDKISKIKKNITGKVYVSTYVDKEHYEYIKRINNDDFEMLPFFDMDEKYQKASDGQHPGKEHYRLFAENIVQYINGKD